MLAFAHQPVLLEEVLTYLQPERGGIYVDGTLGLGGHTHTILERTAELTRPIHVVGIDQDGSALAQARDRLMPRGKQRLTFLEGNFRRMEQLLAGEGIQEVQGILLDLGVSSYQLDDPRRGFTFQGEGELDMRMDPEHNYRTAAQILNSLSEFQLAEIFYEYGEERLSRKIARMIVDRRRTQPWRESAELAEAIRGCYPPPQRFGRIHPATRVFQALRIAVNQELDALTEVLPQALQLLAPPNPLAKDANQAAGILVVISFHSLEDRIVKHFFRASAATGQYEVLTKKPVIASAEEEESNPRSRSAKLRAIRRLT